MAYVLTSFEAAIYERYRTAAPDMFRRLVICQTEDESRALRADPRGFLAALGVAYPDRLGAPTIVEVKAASDDDDNNDTIDPIPGTNCYRVKCYEVMEDHLLCYECIVCDEDAGLLATLSLAGSRAHGGLAGDPVGQGTGSPGTTAPPRERILPIIDVHRVLDEAGVIVPRDVQIVHEPGSDLRAVIDSDFVRLSRDVTTFAHGGAVHALARNGVKGTFSCSCQDGTGSCDIVSTEDHDGNPGVGCISKCSGRCKVFVKIPGDQLGQIAVRALGVELEPDVEVFGDWTGDEGLLITADGLSLRDFGGRFVEGEGGVALLKKDDTIVGSFDCHCRKGSGSCSIHIFDDAAFRCVPGEGCTRCRMVLQIPKVVVGVI